MGGWKTEREMRAFHRRVKGYVFDVTGSANKEEELKVFEAVRDEMLEYGIRGHCWDGDPDLVSRFTAWPCVTGALLDLGANIESKSPWGHYRPLMVACYEGHVKTAELLIRRGADIEAINYHQRNAMQVTCSHHKYDSIRLLAKNGATHPGCRWCCQVYHALVVLATPCLLPWLARGTWLPLDIIRELHTYLVQDINHKLEK